MGFLADICADGDGAVLCARPGWEGVGDISVRDGLCWHVCCTDFVLDSDIERVRLEGQRRKVMNRYQKLAWFNLIVITAALVITPAAVIVEIRWRGYSTIAPWFFIVILLLLKLKPFLFRKPQSEGGVISDERDSFIIKRALSFAYTTFWWVFILSCFLLFLIIGPRNSVPTITLPLMAIGGALFMKIMCSAAILVQYGWGNKGE